MAPLGGPATSSRASRRRARCRCTAIRKSALATSLLRTQYPFLAGPTVSPGVGRGQVQETIQEQGELISGCTPAEMDKYPVSADGRNLHCKFPCAFLQQRLQRLGELAEELLTLQASLYSFSAGLIAVEKVPPEAAVLLAEAEHKHNAAVCVQDESIDDAADIALLAEAVCGVDFELEVQLLHDQQVEEITAKRTHIWQSESSRYSDNMVPFCENESVVDGGAGPDAISCKAFGGVADKNALSGAVRVEEDEELDWLMKPLAVKNSFWSFSEECEAVHARLLQAFVKGKESSTSDTAESSLLCSTSRSSNASTASPRRSVVTKSGRKSATMSSLPLTRCRGCSSPSATELCFQCQAIDGLAEALSLTEQCVYCGTPHLGDRGDRCLLCGLQDWG